MAYSDFELTTAKNGQPSGRISGLNLHSSIDPAKEAERVATSPETEIADFVVVFGAGFGYLVQALRNQDPDRPVLVVEPEPDWFEQVKGHADLDVFSAPMIQTILPRHGDDLVVRLQDAGSRNPVFLPNAAVQKLRPELFELCKSAVRDYKERFQVNVNTLRRFGKLWVKNLARNLDFLATAPGVSGLENAFQEIPGLLVAGGPSLDTSLPYLTQLRERMVIVAVDTSLRACLRATVDPDFVVTVDPQYWNTRHMDGCSESRAVVVSESSVFPRGLRQTSGQLMLCSSLFPLGQYFEQIVEQKGKLGAGGSVATTAWDFLRFLGCTRIYTLGLDLSFPDAQTHFRGSVFEEQTHREACRSCPSEQLRFEALNGAGTYLTKADDGGKVLSDRRMDIYVHWFENQARMHPTVSTLRVGSGSRRIDGIGNAEIEDLLKLEPKRALVDANLRGVAEFATQRASRKAHDLQKLSDARTMLGAELGQMQNTTLRAQSLASLARQKNAEGKSTQNIIRELEVIDNTLIESAQQRVAGFLIEEMIQTLATAAKPTSLDEALSRSEQLYGSIAEVCEYQKALFE